MPPITYHLTLGGTKITPTSTAALVSLDTEAALSVPVNRCRLTLAHPPALALGDAVEIKLGHGSAPESVFKGEVAYLTQGFEGLHLEAVSTLQTLTTARLNLLFEKSTAKDIVQDVAKRFKVTVGKAEAGLKFPVYALGDQTPAYGHLRHLADQCGFDLYGDRADRLVFAPYAPSQTHAFTYGDDILAYAWAEVPSPISGVDIYGESPASQGQGDKAYSWLTKKEVKGSSGSKSGTVLQRADPTARTQAIAAAIAKSLLTASEPQKQGWVRVLGAPAVGLGDRLSLDKLPVAAHNGRYKILSISHRLSARRGFCTTLHWQEEP
ncbi:hypothetical protein IQ265_15215 [Nodosilinea sp. LEGE 06152]|uniref:hypothetical protein n=1 Tax=Nodosilinea sp. LEGE 06152 TaxID=2777966 RepID=UPI00187FCC4C|nr:hypothetical protein [Nodosilinea sp. LEGE 06152]MBE9158167.1 hypothetical protein [Nodosilinea sp. LEGE 06152]